MVPLAALPDTLQLDAQPPALVPGQPATLRCSARRVYPLRKLVVTWYRGDQELQRDDPDATETDEELFDIEATLRVAGEDVVEGVLFRCKLTLTVRTETFTREASVAVSTGGECRGWSWGPCSALSAGAHPHRQALLESTAGG